MKAKTPNQIREEVRKQMASKFNEEKECLKEEKLKYFNLYQKTYDKSRNLELENTELKQKLDALEDWNRRLLEFMDLPDDKRQKSYQTYVDEKEFSEMLTTYLSPFWGNLFSL